MRLSQKNAILQWLQYDQDWVEESWVVGKLLYDVRIGTDGKSRLRELAREGKVEREYRIIKGRRTAFFRFIRSRLIQELRSGKPLTPQAKKELQAETQPTLFQFKRHPWTM